MRYTKYTKEMLEEAVKNNKSVFGVMKSLGYTKLAGGSHSHIKRKILEYQIDINHFTGQAWNRGRRDLSKKSWDHYLKVRDSKRRQDARKLRRSLIEYGKEYKCSKCGNNGEWMDNKLVLEIHHINNIFWDDRPENLEFICPNCHSQITNDSQCKSKINKTKSKVRTKTINIEHKEYLCPDCGCKIQKRSSRCTRCYNFNKRKSLRPSIEELKEMVWSKPTSQIAKQYGVSDNAISKWCKSYGIVKPPRGYWEKVYHNKLAA